MCFLCGNEHRISKIHVFESLVDFILISKNILYSKWNRAISHRNRAISLSAVFKLCKSKIWNRAISMRNRAISFFLAIITLKMKSRDFDAKSRDFAFGRFQRAPSTFNHYVIASNFSAVLRCWQSSSAWMLGALWRRWCK